MTPLSGHFFPCVDDMTTWYTGVPSVYTVTISVVPPSSTISQILFLPPSEIIEEVVSLLVYRRHTNQTKVQHFRLPTSWKKEHF